jgi:hypothetical protein
MPEFLDEASKPASLVSRSGDLGSEFRISRLACEAGYAPQFGLNG